MIAKLHAPLSFITTRRLSRPQLGRAKRARPANGPTLAEAWGGLRPHLALRSASWLPGRPVTETEWRC